MRRHAGGLEGVRWGEEEGAAAAVVEQVKQRRRCA